MAETSSCCREMLFWGGGGMQLETSFGKKWESVCTGLFESKLVEMKLAMAY